MNRTKIEWTEYSWNPITGCLHGCWYCYAKKLFTRFHKPFIPLYYPERLKEPYALKKPSKIFVCSVADVFASWTPIAWRDAVLDSIFRCPIKHTFQLLTKNPERIPDIHFPDNVWVGTTVTNQDGDWRNIQTIKKVKARVRFVSFEPLLSLLPDEVSLSGIQWVIVGKLTGSRKVPLDDRWIYDIILECKRWLIPLFLKNNLRWPEKIQEFPEASK